MDPRTLLNVYFELVFFFWSKIAYLSIKSSRNCHWNSIFSGRKSGSKHFTQLYDWPNHQKRFQTSNRRLPLWASYFYLLICSLNLWCLLTAVAPKFAAFVSQFQMIQTTVHYQSLRLRVILEWLDFHLQHYNKKNK